MLRVKSAGLLTTLASINSVGFAGTGVIEGGTDGNFYGTTSNGGPPGPHLFLRANHAFGQAVLRNPDQPIMR